MAWNLDSDRPIFQQIIERIQIEILSGRYAPGNKLPSVRDLAMEAAVNPNTMQRALAELERMGLVYTQRTSGRFITEDGRMIEKLKEEKAREAIGTFLARMNQIGYSRQDAIDALSRQPAHEGATLSRQPAEAGTVLSGQPSEAGAALSVQPVDEGAALSGQPMEAGAALSGQSSEAGTALSGQPMEAGNE